MFAVMKHWDIMIGIDIHLCWPPGEPAPTGPAPYFVCMLMTGTMLTAEMAFTAITFNGWTMKRGTDIGPLIPHIGPASLLTPLDILFSSSASYFGPSSHTVEGSPVAAALFMFANPNLNCNDKLPLPTGLVLCFTTHYVGMTIFDILFGFISMAVAIAIEVATGKLAEGASKVAQRAMKPVTKRIAAKLASRKAAKAATPSTTPGTGGLTPGTSTTPGTGGLTPGSSTTPAKPPPGAPAKPPPGPWQPAKPSPPGGKTPSGSQPGPQLGQHRPTVKPPKKKLSKKQLALDFGLEGLGELALGVPFTLVNELTFQLLAMTGIEEFGKTGNESPPEET